MVIDADTGADILRKVGNKNKLGIQLSDAEIATIKEYPGRKIGIHNHPSNLYPTGSDFGAAGYRGYDFGLVIAHDGRIFKYSTGNTPVPSIVTDSRIDKYVRKGYTEQEQRNGFEKALNELGKEYGLTWKEIK